MNKGQLIAVYAMSAENYERQYLDDHGDKHFKTKQAAARHSSFLDELRKAILATESEESN